MTGGTHRTPLYAILALALLLRVAAALWPNVHHPDEIYQYLEPAWRLLGHDGVVTWEWRYGMRGWLLPSLFAPLLGLGLAVDPAGALPFALPRLAAACASLAIVGSAWALGARVSRTHAITAAFVAAIWFELVYFAPHTLSEPLSAAAILPAAVMLTRTAPSARAVALAGFLLALGFLFRFQHAPATAVLVALTCWREWRARLLPVTGGGIAALALGALADIAQGAPPLAWLWINIEQNLLHDRAADFGTSPALAYLGDLWAMWSVALVAILLTVRQGWRHAPMLLWMALANLVFLSLIGHKEYRFLFLTVAILVILGAMGSADWIARARSRRALPLALAGWAALSLVLALTGRMPAQWRSGIGAGELFAAVRTDPQACGLALIDTPYFLYPGQFRAGAHAPLHLLLPGDPALGDLGRAMRQSAPAANRLLAEPMHARLIPSAYRRGPCRDVEGMTVCLFTRPNGCDTRPSNFAINRTLERLDR